MLQTPAEFQGPSWRLIFPLKSSHSTATAFIHSPACLEIQVSCYHAGGFGTNASRSTIYLLFLSRVQVFPHVLKTPATLKIWPPEVYFLFLFFVSAFFRHACTSGSPSQTTTTLNCESGQELREIRDMLSLRHVIFRKCITFPFEGELHL